MAQTRVLMYNIFFNMILINNTFFLNRKYGPYQSFSGVGHKTERIKGLESKFLFYFPRCSLFLLAYLTNLGYSVSTNPIPVRNTCEVHVYDLKVFECDIRNLQFGGDGELDDLCHEVLRKITDVTSPSSTP
jgi:hypothetical protein